MLDLVIRKYNDNIFDLFEYLDDNNILYVARHNHIELIDLSILIYT